jgi:hypothetical protein
MASVLLRPKLVPTTPQALSMGIHESQSLFWERMVALGLPFCKYMTAGKVRRGTWNSLNRAPTTGIHPPGQCLVARLALLINVQLNIFCCHSGPPLHHPQQRPIKP